MHILVTGAAGFIGFHLSRVLCQQGHTVTGIDNLNDYYDVNLKLARVNELNPFDNFTFHKMDIADQHAMAKLFREHCFDVVVNLAAQAGVRYSLENPMAYVNSNLVGFANILEGCRHQKVKHLVFASSSSVYGANKKYPFSENDSVDHPVSLYAATKKSNELLAHSYAHLYGLPCTGLRFFTVYGPWGRPDMAYYKFTQKILNGEPIDVYNNGDMWRDFTYIDDVIAGIIKVINQPAVADPAWQAEKPKAATSYAPYRVFNIGHGSPVKLKDFISVIENALSKKAIFNNLPMQPGDVEKTAADMRLLEEAVAYESPYDVTKGINAFVDWYRGYIQTIADKETI